MNFQNDQSGTLVTYNEKEKKAVLMGVFTFSDDPECRNINYFAFTALFDEEIYKFIDMITKVSKDHC